MPATHLSRLGAIALFATTGCSFWFDFEELQTETTELGQDASTPGNDAAPVEICTAESCKDTDPCTDDYCDSDGECVHDAKVRIVEDRIFDPLVADEIHQSTLVASNNTFFVSVFKSDSEVHDTEFYQFSDTATTLGLPTSVDAIELSGIPEAEAATTTPVSALGMVVAGTSPFQLVGYAAIGDSLSGAAKIARFEFGANLTVTDARSVTQVPLYLADRQRHPVVWQLNNNELRAAWRSAETGLYLHPGGRSIIAYADPATPDMAPGESVLDVAAMTDTAGGAAVLWTNASGELRAQAEGDNTSSLLEQCGASPHTLVSLSTARLGTTDAFWFASFTQVDPISSEFGIVQCIPDAGCIKPFTCGSENASVIADQYSSVFAHTTRQQDPDYVSYFVSVTPSIVDSTGVLELQGSIQIDDPEAGASRSLGTVRLGENDTARVPRSPHVAIVAPDKVVTTWIQAAADGSGDELHVTRHRLCLPEQETL